MHLFLDTNIYLGFYKLSGDDLEELKKLAVTVERNLTTLYLTAHQLDEFRRNRAAVIAESLKLVEDGRLPTQFPRMFQGLDRYAELRGLISDFERLRGELLLGLGAAARDHTLQADAVIDGLFNQATTIAVDDDLLALSRLRKELANPPGKPNSIGDAINWEALLRAVPDGQELLLVSADKDYADKLQFGALDEFLVEEWRERKGASVVLYPNLTAVLKAHYPDIRLAAELEKEMAISDLITSPNFKSTHLAIKKLEAFPDLQAADAQAIAEAALANDQISRIMGDWDVRAFYERIAGTAGEQLEPDTRTALLALLAASAEEAE